MFYLLSRRKITFAGRKVSIVVKPAFQDSTIVLLHINVS